MSVEVRRRRGTATEHTTFTGAIGELTVDTTNSRVVVHDGATAGGFPAANFKTGTWTPVLNFGGATTGITYSAQTGSYTQLGNIIIADCGLVLTSKGSATGAATITGMPFSTIGYVGTVECPYYANMALITSEIFGHISSAGSTINLSLVGAAARANLTDANFTNTSDIRLFIIFRM